MFRIPEITVGDLIDRMRVENNLILIDIRKPQEWLQTGIIEGSNLITDEQVLKGIDFGNLRDQIKEKDVIFICRSGNRSGRITQFLLRQREIDVNSIINMKGGIIAWKKQGYPVISPVL